MSATCCDTMDQAPFQSNQDLQSRKWQLYTNDKRDAGHVPNRYHLWIKILSFIIIASSSKRCLRLWARNSIRGCVHPSVRPSVGPWARVKKWENEFYIPAWMLGWELGVDGGWMPLPTRPQQYCDPASLVCFLLNDSYCDICLLVSWKSKSMCLFTGLILILIWKICYFWPRSNV